MSSETTREPPDSCEDCEWALYEGDEVVACTHDPLPPDDEPSPGKPCRYWTEFQDEQ